MAQVHEITEVERLRREKGWPRERLAWQAGISLATLVRVERGHVPRLETAFKIATALGVTIADLFPLEKAAS